MAELFQCSVCGGELKKEEGGNFRCVCCGAAFSEKKENVEETVKRLLGEEKYAMTSAARRNLWRAMHSPEIDSGECAGYARALKSFIPEDYYANFAEIANSKGDREVSEFLSSSSEADMETYADAVLDFMLRSMTPGTLPAVSGYIERAFEKDAKKFSEYFDLYEKEAEKVSEGIYELTAPRDVFLAYSSKDYMVVTDLCAHLEEQGMTCFMSSRNLRHGRGAVENYDVALKTAMDSCNVFVFVSSKNSRSLSCDALKTEISYMRGKDIRFAPAEMKNIPYDKLPASYKACRVEYLLDDYGENLSSADRMVKEFFSGFEWRRTKEEVSDSVLHYLTAQPSYEGVGKAQMERKEKNVLGHAQKLMEMGEFSEAEKNLKDLEMEEVERLGAASAAVYHKLISCGVGVKDDDELVKWHVRRGTHLSENKNYILAMSSEDSEEKDTLKSLDDEIEGRLSQEYDKIGAPSENNVEKGGVTMPGVSSDGVFFGANDAQRKAIVTTEGPVLITAGPGTGKTFTLVQRCAYLIERCGVKAGEIMMATFTEKAAGEISQRLKRELRDRADLDDMYVGTFHAISLRILREHIGKTRLRRGFTMLDDFDQKYLVWENLNSFKRIDGYSLVVKDVNDFNHIRSSWDHAEKICEYVNNLAEELVRPEDLQKDSDPAVRALGNICVRYRELLEEDGYIDFSGLQTECYRLLKSHPEILREMRGKIKYIMVDEYQDTNYIQEQLVFLFGGEACNICVVGDDDQGLYRFRGATIRNILEFPDKVRKMGHDATQVSLLTNYRSETGIIDFYNRWMKTTSGKGFFFDWGKYRFDKKIVPSPDKARNDRCVLRLTADNDPGGWAKKIASFIKGLKSSGFISDFNEVAFLSRSVRNNPMINLINALESEGITVNSPRSGMLFERDEIKLVIGCLIKIFPRYESSLVNDEFDLSASVREYYTHCAKYADSVASEPKNSELKSFLLSYAKRHSQISVTEKYVYSSLLEMLYALEPFKSLLDVDEKEGSITDVRKAKNLGLFMDEIKKFESLHGVKALNDYGVKESTKSLFNTYLRLLYNNGTNEYEFDSDSVPKGCVSFMTIHQSKGMEFPVVFVDSLGSNPSDSADEFMENVEKDYFPQPPFEPEQFIKYYDFWRVYYVAFSRAKKLLVLTCNKKESGRYKEPSDVFVGVYEGLSEPW